jgi:hypothetical protein
VINILECLRAFLDKFPFPRANMMSKHFRTARGTIMEILQRDLEFKKVFRRWVPHQLNSSQKANCVNRSRTLLYLSQQLQPFDFEGITTGDESWFRYKYESDSMFAQSADMVLPRLSAGFQIKTMIIVFLTATRSIVLNSLQQGQSFTQDYFISEIVPAFTKEKLRFRHHHPGVTFSVHIDNSRCHNGRMVTAEFDRRRLGRAEHSLYSPDLSLCGFGSLGS